MTPSAPCLPPLSRPLPDHGTTARYDGDSRRGKPPCRCGPCCNAERLRAKRRRVVGPLTVAAAPVAAYLSKLIADGASRQSIADASGCSVGTVKRVLDDPHHTIRASIRARLLAVTHAPEDQVPVDATGSIRQVRALMAIGREANEIKAATGLAHNIISRLVNGHAEHVFRGTAAAIGDAYERMCMTPGTSARSRNRAAREGWAPPLAWEGLDMSSPDARPEGHERCRRTVADLLEDADFIQRTTGADLDLVAQRLGVKRNSLDKARERAAATAAGGAA